MTGDTENTAAPGAFQLTKFSTTLVECTSEMKELDEEELRMYSIPSLIFSELRAMSENLASRTNVRFAGKLYYRLSEVLLQSSFSPERGKYEPLQRDLKNEKTNLSSILQEAKDLVLKVLAYGDVEGNAQIDWDRNLETLAPFLKGANFRRIVSQQDRASNDDLQDTISELRSLQEKNVFNLYRELIEALKANFLQFSLKSFLQAVGSMQNPGLLADAARFVLISDILIAYLIQQFSVKSDCLSLEGLLQEMETKLRNIEAPEMSFTSSLERAVSKIGGQEVPFQLRERAAHEKNILKKLANTWDFRQQQWEGITLLGLCRAFPGVPQSVVEEAAYAFWSWRMVSSSNRWSTRMHILGVLDHCGDSTDLDTVLEITEAITGACSLFPKNRNVTGIVDLLEEKISILDPFLQTTSQQGNVVSNEVSSLSEVSPDGDCPLEVINKMFTDVQQGVKKMGEEDSQLDLFSLRALKKKAERLSSCLERSRASANKVGVSPNLDTELEDLETQLDNEVASIERRMSFFDSQEMEKKEIAKQRIGSSKTRLETYSGGSPTEFIAWRKEMMKTFPADLYPDQLERCRKVKNFLDLSKHPDIDGVCRTMDNADRVLEYLQNIFGSELRSKQYIIAQVWKIKKCTEDSEVALVCQLLISVKSQLKKIDEFSSFTEVHVNFVLRKLRKEENDKFDEKVKALEYKKLKALHGLEPEQDVPSEFELNPGAAKESLYRVTEQERTSMFWEYIIWLSFYKSPKLTDHIKKDEKPSNGSGKKFRLNQTQFGSGTGSGTGRDGGGDAGGGGATKQPTCYFLSCSTKKSSPHWSIHCPSFVKPYHGGVIQECIKSGICVRCVKSIKEEGDSSKQHQCPGFYQVRDKKTNKFKKVNSDCRCGSRVKSVPINYLLCACRKNKGGEKDKGEKKKQQPNNAAKQPGPAGTKHPGPAGTKKTFYQVWCDSDGVVVDPSVSSPETSKASHPPWHKTEVEQTPPFQSYPMPHQPHVSAPQASAPGVGSRVSQMWHTAASPSTEEMVRSAFSMDRRFQFETAPSEAAPSVGSTLQWKAFQCGVHETSRDEVGVLISPSDIPCVSMKIQGKVGQHSSKNKGIKKSNLNKSQKDKYQLPEYIPVSMDENTVIDEVSCLDHGQASMYIEWSYWLDMSVGKLRLLRSLSDGGSNCNLIDQKLANEMHFPWRSLGKKHTVYTAHGVSTISREYMVTFRVATGKNEYKLKKAKFLGFEKLSAFYPSYRIQLPGKFRQKFNLSNDHFFQKEGNVDVILGSGLTAYFPHSLYHEGNFALARSSLSGNLLVQGCPITGAGQKPEMVENVCNFLRSGNLGRVESNAASDGILNQILGEEATLPDLTSSENESSSDSSDEESDDDDGELPPLHPLTDTDNSDSSSSDESGDDGEKLPPLVSDSSDGSDVVTSSGDSTEDESFNKGGPPHRRKKLVKVKSPPPQQLDSDDDEIWDLPSRTNAVNSISPRTSAVYGPSPFYLKNGRIYKLDKVICSAPSPRLLAQYTDIGDKLFNSIPAHAIRARYTDFGVKNMVSSCDVKNAENKMFLSHMDKFTNLNATNLVNISTIGISDQSHLGEPSGIIESSNLGKPSENAEGELGEPSKITKGINDPFFRCPIKSCQRPYGALQPLKDHVKNTHQVKSVVNNGTKNVKTLPVTSVSKNVKILPVTSVSKDIDLVNKNVTDSITVIKLPQDEVLKCFHYKIDSNVVYREDGSIITDKVGFYKKYDVNSIDLPPNRNCSRCKTCSCLIQKDSEQAEAVSQEMFKKIKFNDEYKKRKFSGQYIFRENPLDLNLKDNRHSALKDAKRMSVRIKKLGKEQADTFNKQVLKAITNEALQRVLPGMFIGFPSRFSPTVYAFSGKEATTPVRFCADSSRDPFDDHTSFNLLTLKGNGGNNLSEIMLQLRCNLFAAITDLSAAYHLIRVGDLEASLRRVWIPVSKQSGELAWGEDDHLVEWQEFCWRSVAFGDVGGSSLLYNVIKKAAELFATDATVKHQLVNQSYVDDITATGQTAVARDQVQSGIEKVLNRCALTHCEWTQVQYPPHEITPGPPTQSELAQMSKIFGHSYVPTKDAFVLKICVNLHNFVRGRPMGDPLMPGENVSDYVNLFQVTKRLLARVCMSVYDLTGYLLLPQMVNRLFFHKALLYEENILGWDSIVSSEVKKEFVKNIELIMSLDNYTWPRCALPRYPYKVNDNSPMVIYPSDGSGSACVSYAYLVVERADDDPKKTLAQPNHVSIVKAAGKICSAGSDSVPRLELASLVLSCKLTEALQHQLPVKVSKSLYLSDSSTAILQCQSRTALYSSWVLPRLRYVKETFDVSTQLFKVPGVQNPSDLGTKLVPDLRAAMESDMYMHGCFMRTPFKSWPLTKLPPAKNMSQLPEVMEKYRMFSNSTNLVKNETNISDTDIPGGSVKNETNISDTDIPGGSVKNETNFSGAADISGEKIKNETCKKNEIFVVVNNQLRVVDTIDHVDLVEVSEFIDDNGDEEGVIFNNPIEDFFDAMIDTGELRCNRIFSNPTKKSSDRAPKVKSKYHQYPNQEIRGLFSSSQMAKYESQVEQCEYFGRQQWKYKIYLGKEHVEHPDGAFPLEGKNGGAFQVGYSSFFQRRRDFTKTLTSLGYALKWLPKYRSWPMSDLRDHITMVLAKMCMPWTMLMLSRMRLKDTCQYLGNLMYVQHRRILESKYPEFSVLLSPKSNLAKAIALSLHENLHDMDNRSYSSILKQDSVPKHIPHLNRLLTSIEKECVTCRLRLSIPSFAREGALPKVKVTPVSHWSQSTLDLAGPIEVNQGRSTKKVWLGILVSANSGLLYVDLLEDYSSKSVDLFLQTFELDMCVKLRYLLCDAGSQLTGMRQYTKKEELGRLRSQTREMVEENEAEEGLDEDELMRQFVKDLRLTSARRGYLLRIAPPFAHHRLGSCERVVHLLKTFFKGVSRNRTLTTFQLRYLVKKFSYQHNSRPVCISGRGASYLSRIHLLSGRTVPYFQEAADTKAVSSHRRWKEDAAGVDDAYNELFQEFLILKESEYLELHHAKFSADDTPAVGDLVHLRSMPSYLHFSLGIIIAVEESDDKESRTYWVRISRPSSPTHPGPYDEVTQQPEIFRRDIQDLVLLMRKEQLGDDFTGNLYDTKVEDVDKKVEEAIEEAPVEAIEEAPIDKLEDPKDVLQKPSENVVTEEVIEEASVDKMEDPIGVVQKPSEELNDVVHGSSKKQKKNKKKVTFKKIKKSNSEEDYLRNVTKGGEGDNKKLVPSISGLDAEEDIEDLDVSDASVETTEWSPSFHSSPGYQEDDSHSDNGSEDTIPWRDSFDQSNDEVEEVKVETDHSTPRRARRPPGFYRNMSTMFQLLFIFCILPTSQSTSQGYDLKKPRMLGDICRWADLNYYAGVKGVTDAIKTRDLWADNTGGISLPNQIGLFYSLPVLEMRVPSTFDIVSGECARLKGKLVEWDDSNDFNFIKKIAVKHGYTHLTSHVRLDNHQRFVWGSGDVFSMVSPVDNRQLRTLLSDVRYQGRLRWELSTRTVVDSYGGDIARTDATFCWIQDSPFFQRVRAFHVIATNKIASLKALSPTLEDMRKELEEAHKVNIAHHAMCNAIHVDIVSPAAIDYVEVQPRLTVSSASELESQNHRFSSFITRYKNLQRELHQSISFWIANSDVHMSVIIAGSVRHILFDNIGWNTFTLLLILSSMPMVALSMFLLKKIHSYTFAKKSCLRYWWSKFNKKVLRRKKRRNRKLANKLDVGPHEEFDDLEIEDEEKKERALVPYRRARAPAPPRRQLLELQDYS